MISLPVLWQAYSASALGEGGKLADLIDAVAWDGSSEVYGDRSSDGYTAVSWADTANGSADDGLTITPNGGDTGKILFIPNAGFRSIIGSNGRANGYGSYGRSWSVDENQSGTSAAWYFEFSSGTYTSGRINSTDKLIAKSLRCVRS